MCYGLQLRRNLTILSLRSRTQEVDQVLTLLLVSLGLWKVQGSVISNLGQCGKIGQEVLNATGFVYVLPIEE